MNLTDKLTCLVLLVLRRSTLPSVYLYFLDTGKSLLKAWSILPKGNHIPMSRDLDRNGQYLRSWIFFREVISSASPKPIKSLSLSELVMSFHCFTFNHLVFSSRLSRDQDLVSFGISIFAISESSSIKWTILSRNFANRRWTLSSDHDNCFLKVSKIVYHIRIHLFSPDFNDYA